MDRNYFNTNNNNELSHRTCKLGRIITIITFHRVNKYQKLQIDLIFDMGGNLIPCQSNRLANLSNYFIRYQLYAPDIHN